MVIVWGIIGIVFVLLLVVIAERVLLSVQSFERIRPGDTHPTESHRPRWLQDSIGQEELLAVEEPDDREAQVPLSEGVSIEEDAVPQVSQAETVHKSPSTVFIEPSPWTSGSVRVGSRARTVTQRSNSTRPPFTIRGDRDLPLPDCAQIASGARDVARLDSQVDCLPYPISEFHYITPIENVPSILRLGILSYNSARNLDHRSVAMAEVNQRRHHRVVANGLTVHDHANLYFNARNPMMYKRREEHSTLCVLRISTNVLSKPWLAVADGNAASDDTIIRTAWQAALENLDYQTIFAERWNTVYDGKRKRCAELLVLGEVEPSYIIGAYVSCATSLYRLSGVAPTLPATISEHMFFSSPR